MRGLPGFGKRHIYQIGGLLLVAAWCAPYFTSGSRIEWGDFSFFAQAYEAIRQSILEYHQFPWWNPWISGGIPLYANPQMGVFSIQTIFVLFFGASIGLKLAIAFYTVAGYASMQLLLRKYFKVEYRMAILLSLAWIFCSFFVAHLPPHFTFVWYMLTPLYVYLALTVKDWKSGLVLGGALAVMALSAVHNPFFHITLIISVIIGIRFILLFVRKRPLKAFLLAMAAAAGLFILIAGHRVIMVVQNVKQFPRVVPDPAADPLVSVMGLVWPFSLAHNQSIPFQAFPAPYGFGEVSATIGMGALAAALLSVLFLAYKRTALKAFVQQFRIPLIVLAAALVCLSLGFGALHSLTPYNVLKHVPVFGEMRVSSRWFVFFNMALLIFIGIVASRAPRKSFFKLTAYCLVTLSVIQLFVLNVGYQNYILGRDIVQPIKDSKSYTFTQTSMFGTLPKLPDGTKLPNDGSMPHFYREYEATLFNTGTLQANDALVDLNTKATPRCAYEKGCGLVLSNNAKVKSWTPNKIVLERTGKGRIKMNINNSSYYLVNGKRNSDVRVAEPYIDFYISQPDSVKTITIEVKPY